MRRLIAMGLLVGAGIVTFTLTSSAEVYVGRRSAGTVSLQDIDHSAWHRLLQTWVDDDGFVDYRGWHADSSSRQALKEYLVHLSAGTTESATSTEAKLAFWINAYNAVTIHGILQEYPTTSIRNHTPRLVGYNIWKHLQLYVDGTPYSLNQIEHQILRKMGEPQIHFAIVCASISCPRLLNEAYTPNHVRVQLDRNSEDFFRRRRNFDYSDGRFRLSAILDWFGKDFGSTKAERLQAIAEWLPTDEARQAAASGQGEISYLDYNWKLNEQQ